MSFFDKLKSGMSEASSKAKIVVEVNKLKLINASKQNDIKQLYKEIGSKVFKDRQLGITFTMNNYMHDIEQIDILHTEIEQNKLKIINLGDMKICSDCDSENTVDAISCKKCGKSFVIGNNTSKQDIIEIESTLTIGNKNNEE